MRANIIAALLILIPVAAFGQKWEFGVDGGVGLLNHVDVSTAAGSATAGFAPGFVAGAFAGQTLYSHVAGELRYEYMESNLRLSSGSQTAQFSGAAHALHYDIRFHTRQTAAPVGFFVALGGGVKIFAGTGTEAAVQPLSQFGYFTKTKAIKPLVTAAAGLSFRLAPKLFLWTEIRDYASAFPTAVLTPPPGAKYGSLLNDVVPMVSIVFTR